MLLPTTAFAATKSYGISCANSDFVWINAKTKGEIKLACDAANTPVRIEGNGGAVKPYPKGASVGVITFDCGKSTAPNARIGAPAFPVKCNNGSLAPFSSFNEVQTHRVPVSPTPTPAPVGTPAPAPPPPSSCNASSCDLVTTYVQPMINLLSGIVGIMVVISLILGGVEYSTSEGDPQKSAKAKRRIANTLFALMAYIFLYAFLQFLIPNGLFH